ncbi:hypothetical protein EK21DRAFT_88879 [Setomelanomma holmii]|uniref:Uncharacterized protein n=1 Tax=Setomelanomma holmii TaxID=210430 RepID=A0A9P4HCH7_9PLEO|nr:hypothetical protein EK21DRAFT_88879 [Setomelanomma holmii]
MEIPKTTFAPSEHTVPSFLTLLPEVRNLVSELLFERVGPVMIHNVRAYYAQKPTAPERDPDEPDSDGSSACAETDARNHGAPTLALNRQGNFVLDHGRRETSNSPETEKFEK